MRVVLAVLTLAAVVVDPAVASAETKTVDTTYEVENLEAYPDQVFVAWPRTCGSTGDPLGAVSLQLNPDWVARLHEVDYEVLENGKRHEVSSYCLTTMRIHALPAAAFPRAIRVATVDDSALGKKPGEAYAVLPALDAIDLPKRIPFFASDPRRVSSPFRFDAASTARPKTAVHYVLAIEAGNLVQLKRAVYTHEQGPPETLSFPLDAGASSSVDAGVAPTATPAPHTPDLGTRWVYAAAIGGLLAGGVIAHYRKKRAK